MRTTGFGKILHNRHVRALVTPLRVACTSPEWRREHPEVPFWQLLSRLAAATRGYERYPEAYAPALTALLDAIGRAAPQLRYNTDDLDSYLTLVELEGRWLAAAFLAYASARGDYVTPAQVAAATGTAESTWRNRAAAGDIPGACKAGKQWLLPTDVLALAYGVEMPDGAGRPDPTDVAVRGAEALEPPMSEEEYRHVLRALDEE